MVQVLVNLKSTIAARGWTQVDFAISLKIPATMLSEIIHERREANVSLRARIAAALHTNESWLFSCVVDIPAPAIPPQERDQRREHKHKVLPNSGAGGGA
jgi:transcriptional regulator with XRE-family HTH domain